MNNEQILVAELLKLKAKILKEYNANVLKVSTKEVLDSINSMLEKVNA